MNGLLQQELTHLLQNELSDPRLEEVDVTRVVVSRDLSSARVFFTVSGAADAEDAEVRDALAGWENATSYIRRRLAEDANLKRVPDFVFNFDASQRVLQLLDEVAEERVESAPAEGAEPGRVFGRELAESGEAGVRRPVVRLVQGDITEQAVDAIVNAANTDLRLGSGVAGAIRERGGPTIQEECNAKAPIAMGEAAITGAGELPARHVIHAAAMGYREGEGKPTADSVEAAYRNSLKRALENKLLTVAVPALGTGVGEFPAEACARILRRVVEEWRREGHAYPETVVACLFDDETFGAFREVFEPMRGAGA